MNLHVTMHGDHAVLDWGAGVRHAAIGPGGIAVKGGEGENTIPVSWSGGQTNLKGFKVYIDPNAGLPGSNVAGNGGQTVDAGQTSVDAGATIDNFVDGGVITSAPNPNCPSSVLVGGGGNPFHFGKAGIPSGVFAAYTARSAVDL